MRADRIAPVLATALAVTLAVSGASAAASQPRDGVSLTSVPDTIGFDATPRVPVVESQLGVGPRLSTDPTATVPLPPTPDSVDGALVRVTVFDAPSAVTVFAAGAPALSVPSGSGSTTVLVPVVDGAVPLHGSVPADVRIEILATFVGAAGAPGSTVALPTPVTRADTAHGLAGEHTDDTVTSVGVTGLGGVPATGVRAVYLTVTATVASPSTLSVGGQLAPVAAGTTSVTTVVPPEPDGTVPVRLVSGSGDVRVDVRGWVPEAPQNAEAVNVTGSFVPAHDARPVVVGVSDAAPTSAALGGPADGAAALVLVSGTAPEHTTVVDVGGDHDGRARGAVADPALGVLPQLVLVPSGAPAAAVTIRRGHALVTVTPVGGVLAEPSARATAPALSITGPADGTAVDLGTGATLTLHGTVGTTASSLRSVQVFVGTTNVGTAVVRYAGSSTTWSLDTAVPSSGSHTFRVVATDRSGEQTSRSVTVDVALPRSGDTVIADDVSVVPSAGPDGSPTVSALGESSVLLSVRPAFAPGDVIVSDATPAAPRGFLRHAVSIDRTADGWLVHTAPATLTDAILQADEDDVVDLLGAGTPSVHEHHDTTDVDVVDDGIPAVQVVRGADLDVAAYPDAGGTDVVVDPASARTTTRTRSVVPAAFEVDDTLTGGFKVTGDYTWETGKPRPTDASQATVEYREKAATTLRAVGGLSVSGTAQFTMSLHLVLKLDVQWSWGVPSVVVDDFVVAISSMSKAEVTAEAYLKVDTPTTKSTEQEIAETRLPTVTLWVLAVPVVISTEAGLELGASFSAQASVSVTLGVQRTETYGFGYSSDGGVRSIVEYPTTTYTTPVFGRHGDAAVTGEVEVTFGPSVTYDISIYDVAGPAFTVGARAGAEAKVVKNVEGTTVDVAAFLDAYAGGRAELKVPIIDRVLFAVDLFSYQKRFTLASWHWSFDEAFPVVEEPAPGTDEPEDQDPPGQDPTDPEPEAPRFVSFAGGPTQLLALTADGRVFASGGNWAGQLGDGTTVDRDTLAPVPGLREVVSVANGSSSSFAVTQDGHVYAWGYNGLGQLGDGTQLDRTTPVLVPGLSDVVSVAAGNGPAGESTLMLAVTRAGRVYVWGPDAITRPDDTPDQVRFSTSPVLVEGVSDVVAAAAGWTHALAVTRGGQVYEWGLTSYASPTLVAGLPAVSSVSASLSRSSAVTRDGRLYTWTSTRDGLTAAPAVVPGLADVVAATVEYSTAMALTRDGHVFVWGYNADGRLGDGTTVDQPSPVLVPGLSEVVSISNNGAALAVTRDGRVYGWGYSPIGDPVEQVVTAPTLVPLPPWPPRPADVPPAVGAAVLTSRPAPERWYAA